VDAGVRLWNSKVEFELSCMDVTEIVDAFSPRHNVMKYLFFFEQFGSAAAAIMYLKIFSNGR